MVHPPHYLPVTPPAEQRPMADAPAHLVVRVSVIVAVLVVVIPFGQALVALGLAPSGTRLQLVVPPPQPKLAVPLTAAVAGPVALLPLPVNPRRLRWFMLAIRTSIIAALLPLPVIGPVNRRRGRRSRNSSARRTRSRTGLRSRSQSPRRSYASDGAGHRRAERSAARSCSRCWSSGGHS